MGDLSEALITHEDRRGLATGFKPVDLTFGWSGWLIHFASVQ